MTRLLILIASAQLLCVGLSRAQSSDLIGNWKVEVTFENGETHSFRFEAQESGKGSFELTDAKSKVWGPAKSSEANWTQGDKGSVMFSGMVEFPLGNVGRDRGTLVLKGKFGSESTITGGAAFFRPDRDPKDPKGSPSKSGTFKAIRIAVG